MRQQNKDFYIIFNYLNSKVVVVVLKNETHHWERRGTRREHRALNI